MKNLQLAGSQDDRAGTGWVRRWWTGDKLSVRLFEVAFVLVLAGAMAWMEWFASDSQAATWSTVLAITAVGGGLRPAWPRRAIAIARAGVVVVAVAASGVGSACPSVPADRAISGAAGAGLLAAAGGAGVFAVVVRGAGWERRLGPASERAVRFVMGGLGGCHRDW
jgi:hypothetical protein